MLCQDLCRLLGLKRKRVERSRELLLPAGVGSEAELGLEGRGDEKFELEGTESGWNSPALGRQMQVVQGWQSRCPGTWPSWKSPKMHIFLHSCKAERAKGNIWVLAVFIERQRKKNPKHIQSNPGFFPFVST